jgi:hypothetical protein
MGRGEEMATALGTLAIQMKSLVPVVRSADPERSGDLEEVVGMFGVRTAAREQKKVPEEDKDDTAKGLYDRLRSAISVMEDMEGVSRGFYMGAALELQLSNVSDASGPAVLMRAPSILSDAAEDTPTFLSGKKDDGLFLAPFSFALF